jgi:hypothetical protein
MSMPIFLTVYGLVLDGVGNRSLFNSFDPFRNSAPAPAYFCKC